MCFLCGRVDARRFGAAPLRPEPAGARAPGTRRSHVRRPCELAPSLGERNELVCLLWLASAVASFRFAASRLFLMEGSRQTCLPLRLPAAHSSGLRAQIQTVAAAAAAARCVKFAARPAGQLAALERPRPPCLPAPIAGVQTRNNVGDESVKCRQRIEQRAAFPSPSGGAAPRPAGLQSNKTVDQ